MRVAGGQKESTAARKKLNDNFHYQRWELSHQKLIVIPDKKVVSLVLDNEPLYTRIRPSGRYPDRVRYF